MTKNAKAPEAETEEQEVLSISTITVEIPLTIVPSAVGGKHYTLNCGLVPRKEQARIFGHLIARGLRISLDNVYGHDKTQTVAQKHGEAAKRLAEIQDGTFNPSERGGSRMTPQQAGWVTWFNDKEHKEDGKAVSSKTLRRAQETLCRRDILDKAGPAGSPGRKDAEANLKKHLDERFEKWVAWKETADPDLKEAIRIKVLETERKARAKQAAETPIDLGSADF